MSGKIEENGTCIFPSSSTDIVVTGALPGQPYSGWFNPVAFNQYILPYFPGQESYFRLMPVNSFIDRMRELQRRRRIHDCIANNLAAGMRAIGQWTVREVTFDYYGYSARFDIVYGTIPNVPLGVLEVKTVLDYGPAVTNLLVRKQPLIADAIVRGLAIP